ncbi:transposon Ty2-F/Ty2-GR1 Gag-Pol polyprotein [Kluyveromyces marxianus]|uniref:Transposon Ty2-F/Ty2-GR1 Gag-Pol polyprotein n=1 Tax=Kluyveromyces marxianus TaxID=4911 RepID=A0ABX6EYU8_KLUMA|nr:transposon Ty2-F/Ty2-GR1 Gag-Pol polyprotein [Kluyveromyces marxianus]
MFGHMNINYIRESFRKGLIQGVKEDDVDWTGVSSFQCQYCMEGKAKRNNHYVNARKRLYEGISSFRILTYRRFWTSKSTENPYYSKVLHCIHRRGHKIHMDLPVTT